MPVVSEPFATPVIGEHIVMTAIGEPFTMPVVSQPFATPVIGEHIVMTGGKGFTNNWQGKGLTNSCHDNALTNN
jgi:hypothetical protein